MNYILASRFVHESDRKAKEVLIHHDMKSRRVHVYGYSGDYLRNWETSFFFNDGEPKDELISASLKAFFQQVDERSNPVLAFYRFKQF